MRVKTASEQTAKTTAEKSKTNLSNQDNTLKPARKASPPVGLSSKGAELKSSRANRSTNNVRRSDTEPKKKSTIIWSNPLNDKPIVKKSVDKPVLVKDKKGETENIAITGRTKSSVQQKPVQAKTKTSKESIKKQEPKIAVKKTVGSKSQAPKGITRSSVRPSQNAPKPKGVSVNAQPTVKKTPAASVSSRKSRNTPTAKPKTAPKQKDRKTPLKKPENTARVAPEVVLSGGRLWRMAGNNAVVCLSNAQLACDLFGSQRRNLDRDAMATYTDKKGRTIAWQFRFNANRWDEIATRLI